ncbi:MAG: hypothetical protein L6R36_007588 [Xanthoria steineri]|nr:MAG: hypothetical protein L6R36_007588 [Xanthoria steineri]
MESLLAGSLHLQSLAQVLLCVFTVYLIAGGCYRLYFSPLAKFPGPRLAALTHWVEFYYDLVKGGRFQHQIGEWHQQYGPIIRINPNELHIQDTDFYDQLYRRENKLDKYPGQTKMFGVPGVLVASDSHEVHRRRRVPLAPFFSRKAVSEMSSVIEERLKALSGRIRDFQNSGTAMPLGLGYVALTTDIISEYALADCYHLLEREDLGADYHQLLVGFVHSCHFIRHFTWLFNFIQALPDPVLLWLQPSLKLARNIMKVRSIFSLRNRVEGKPSGSEPGIFAGLLRSNLPPPEKSADRMSSEGMGLLVAGSETTAQTLSITTYHILANPNILAELRKQLQVAIPEAGTLPPLADLEAVPYLYACVQEGLRLSYGISGRLMRVCHSPLEYQSWVIPAGVPVGMTTVFMHDDEDVFPDHRSFKPERWLEKREDGIRLDKYLTAFGKGDRQCIGMNLAHAELYLTLATIFRRFDLELFDTERSTVQYYRDYFNSFPKNGCDGVRVLVK